MLNHRSYRLLLIALAAGVLLFVGGALVVTVGQIPLDNVFTADMPDCRADGSVPGVEQCTQGKCQLDGKNENTGYFCDCVATKVSCCERRNTANNLCVKVKTGEGKYYSCKYNVNECKLPENKPPKDEPPKDEPPKDDKPGQNDKCAAAASGIGCQGGVKIGDKCTDRAGTCQPNGAIAGGSGRKICDCVEPVIPEKPEEPKPQEPEPEPVAPKPKPQPTNPQPTGTDAPAVVTPEDQTAANQETIEAAREIVLVKSIDLLVDLLKQ